MKFIGADPQGFAEHFVNCELGLAILGDIVGPDLAANFFIPRLLISILSYKLYCVPTY